MRDLNSFIKDCGFNLERNYKFTKRDAKYIDYVNIGFKRNDGMYDFVQFWRTDKNEIVFDNAGKGCPLSNGLFDFCRDTFHPVTRVVENGRVTIDYRED